MLIEVEGERISALTSGVDPPPSASRLPGLTIPGLANVHSHAFHSALRGPPSASPRTSGAGAG
jgi:cytosine/adenosine deaminase-related metal-dependent hydrolase